MQIFGSLDSVNNTERCDLILLILNAYEVNKPEKGREEILSWCGFVSKTLIL